MIPGLISYITQITMADTIFRPSGPSGAGESAPMSAPDPEPADPYNLEIQGQEDITPLEMDNRQSGSLALEVMGVEESLGELPTEVKSSLSEIENYVKAMIEKKGLEPTKGVFSRTFDKLKQEMGIDPDTTSDEVIKRMGGVIQAYRDISFISDPKERRALFMKLARQPSVEDMNRMVYDTMTKYQVWQ